jgi:hypothetical protein
LLHPPEQVRGQAGALSGGRLGADWLGALGAHRLHDHLAAASAVLNHTGRALGIGCMPIPPVHQGQQRKAEFLAFGGGAVFVAGRAVGVAEAFEQAGGDLPGELVGEHVAGNAEAVLEGVEAAQPSQRVPRDQQGLAFADDFQGAGNGAGLGVVGPSEQALRLARWVA